MVKEVLPPVLQEMRDEKILSSTIEAMEMSYLLVALGIERFRSGFARGGKFQVVSFLAGETLLGEMAMDIKTQTDSDDFVVLLKPFSRSLIPSALHGYGGESFQVYPEETFMERGVKILNSILGADEGFGSFNPRLPTLWIDSSLEYSFVQWLNQPFLAEVPVGASGVFMSILKNPPPDLERGRFEDLWGPDTLLPGFGRVPIGFQYEMWLRLPIEKTHVDPWGCVPLQYSEERKKNNRFYAGMVWAHGPDTLGRRRELLAAAGNCEQAVSEASIIREKAGRQNQGDY